MDFGLGTYALGFLAGLLSTLSPCVLPLIPILLGTAITQHRYGAFALIGGLVASFAVLGTAIAFLGASFGINQEHFRAVGAALLIAFGVMLLSTTLQYRFAVAAAGLSSGGESVLAQLKLDGLAGQFIVGLTLGVIWSPCVGPTLG